MAGGHAGIGWGAGRAAITGFLPAVEVSRRDPGPSLARLAAVGLARRAEAVVARATERTGEGLGLLEGFFRAVREQRFGDAFDALEAVARRHPSPMDAEDLAEVPALLVELCFEGLARDAEDDRISPSWMRRAELLRPPTDRARMEYVQYGWIRMGQAVQHYGDGDPTGARVAFAESERYLTTGLHPSARDPDMRQAIARARRALAPALADREPTAPDYVSSRGPAQHWIGRIEGREGPGYTVRVTYASALSKYARGAEIAVSSDEIELLTRVSLDATQKGWR